jgi:hypothetical protein
LRTQGFFGESDMFFQSRTKLGKDPVNFGVRRHGQSLIHKPLDAGLSMGWHLCTLSHKWQ